MYLFQYKVISLESSKQMVLGNLSAELQVIGRKQGNEKVKGKRTEGMESSTLIRKCDLTNFKVVRIEIP